MKGKIMKEKSLANLKAAFAGESQANRSYLAFAKKAEEEGYMQAAKLFKAAAEAETVHAHNHLNAMGAVKSTKENLAAAVGGETHEFTEMYPAMIEDAKAEGENEALRSFNYANKVEEIHAGFFNDYLKNIEHLKVEDIWVCPVCGNTFIGSAEEKCSICATLKSRYIKI